MTQRLKQTRWQRLTNNILSHKEAWFWITVVGTLFYFAGRARLFG